MSEGEVVDLTADSPRSPRSLAGRKRARDSDDGAASSEERQRLSIMAAAAAIRAGQGRGPQGRTPTHDPAAVTPASGSLDAIEEVTPDDSEALHDEEAHRQRIMQHARAVRDAATEVPAASSLLAQLAAERVARRGPPPAAAAAPAESGPLQVNVLSYNVWFREDVALVARMAALGQIIMQSGYPEVIALQEVTPTIQALLSSSAWFQRYTSPPELAPRPDASYFTMLLWRSDRVTAGRCAAIPFANSLMDRDLKAAALSIDGHQLRVATTHLESPTGWRQLYSKPRRAQCERALGLLDKMGPDVLFLGDMNWNEKNDEDPPLPEGWVDAWPELHSGSAYNPGFTYDTVGNPMLGRNNNGALRLRLDRAFCKLHSWQLRSLKLVGKQALPGLSFEGRPVLPSDHYGLLLGLTLA